MTQQPEFKSLLRDELAATLHAWGEPVYRTKQILDWVYRAAVNSFDQMTNLPAGLRQKLAETYRYHSVHSLRTRQSSDTTEKFLFELSDGSLIETVLIPATPGRTTRSDRLTLCVSTQVGCAYGCRFCASGLDGVKRDLTAGEIIDQIWQAQQISGQTVDNIVVMGMGEPLANYSNLIRALKIINGQWALGIGARKITVSTVGLAPQIRQLADEPLQVRLAVSLHGATDEVRGRIMPVNRKYPLDQLLAACEYYCQARQQMLMFEYILIDGVNDGLDQAERLAGLARKLHAKVNLIPYNPVPGLEWSRPSRERCKAFQHTMREKGINPTLRLEKGMDINAACGQLRLQQKPPIQP